MLRKALSKRIDGDSRLVVSLHCRIAPSMADIDGFCPSAVADRQASQVPKTRDQQPASHFNMYLQSRNVAVAQLLLHTFTSSRCLLPEQPCSLGTLRTLGKNGKRLAR